MSDSDNHYHTLRRKIWNELDKAISDRRHGWRTPVLATIDDAGLPDARTVVLREVNPENQQLTIYTDKRSPKVSQISKHPDVALVFWCAHLNWQLRIQASAILCDSKERTNTVWHEVSSTAGAADYLSIQAPSSPLYYEGLLDADQHALCIVYLEIKCIDWLSLSQDGHKRAKLVNNRLTWLTP